MKKILLKLGILLFVCPAFNSYAQLTPQPSSAQTLIQDFGLSKITLTYSRPNIKGRKIFGNMEPYGVVWRTGANSATIIKFTDAVKINGHDVPAGEYSLFSIPGKREWVVILNKTAKQWGAYNYRQADDYLRFTVKTEKLKKLTETMTLAFENVTPEACDLHMMWEHSGFTCHLTIDDDAKIMAGIDSAMNTARKPYYEAIIYYWNHDKDMGKALVWANELDKATNFPPYVSKLWHARVLLKKGDKAAAIKMAQDGVDIAKKEKSDEYVRLNSQVIAEAGK